MKNDDVVNVRVRLFSLFIRLASSDNFSSMSDR